MGNNATTANKQFEAKVVCVAYYYYCYYIIFRRRSIGVYLCIGWTRVRSHPRRNENALLFLVHIPLIKYIVHIVRWNMCIIKLNIACGMAGQAFIFAVFIKVCVGTTSNMLDIVDSVHLECCLLSEDDVIRAMPERRGHIISNRLNMCTVSAHIPTSYDDLCAKQIERWLMVTTAVGSLVSTCCCRHEKNITKMLFINNWSRCVRCPVVQPAKHMKMTKTNNSRIYREGHWRSTSPTSLSTLVSRLSVCRSASSQFSVILIRWHDDVDDNDDKDGGAMPFRFAWKKSRWQTSPSD